MACKLGDGKRKTVSSMEREVIYSDRALADLRRLRRFLLFKNDKKLIRILAIRHQLELGDEVWD